MVTMMVLKNEMDSIVKSTSTLTNVNGVVIANHLN